MRPPEALGRGFRPSIAALAVVAAGLLAFTSPLERYKAWRDPAQVAERRLIELRRSVGAGAEPAGRLSIESEPGAPVALDAVERARQSAEVEAAVEALVEEGRVDEARLTRARLDLLSGAPTAAIDALGPWIGLDDPDADLRLGGDLELDAAVDLAAALMTRARDEDVAIDLVVAARVLGAALDRERRPDVLYNHALVLDRLHLRTQTEIAWRQVLAVEPDAGWAQRARRQLDRHLAPPDRPTWKAVLDGAIARPAGVDRAFADRAAHEWPHEAGEHARTLIFEAAHAVLAGDLDAAAASLDVARILGEALADHRGDHQILDEAELWLRRLESQDPDRGRDFARLTRYGEALSLEHEERDLEGAEIIYRQLRPAFEVLGSTYALECALRAEVSRHYRSSSDALAALDAVLDTVPERYPWLRGRMLWMMGISAVSRSRYAAAERLYSEARGLIEASAGRARATMIDTVRAESFDLRGEIGKAWQLRRKALAVLGGLRDPKLHFSSLIESSQALNRRRQHRLALMVLAEADASGHRWVDAAAETALERARSLVEIGRLALARRQLDVMATHVDHMDPGYFQDRFRGLATLVEASMRMDIDPTTSLSLLEQVSELFDQIGFKVTERHQLMTAAQAYETLGSKASAAERLEQTIALQERASREAGEALAAIDSFRQAEPALDRLISNYLQDETVEESERMAKAFLWTERRRLLSAARWQSRTSPPAELAARLPIDTILLVYVALPDRWLCWIFENGNYRVARLDEDTEGGFGQSPARAQAAIENLLGALRDRDLAPTVPSLASEVSRRLLEGLDLDLEAASRLVVVPDGALEDVPFALLPHGGQKLVEKVAVAYAPSASLYIEAAERGRGVHPEKLLLAVAQEVDSGARGGTLPRLVHGLIEARVIERFFETRVLASGSATRGQVLDALSEHDIFHFAGHATASERTWSENALLLASEIEGSPSYLGLSEILESSARPRLVTLAACETLRGYDAGRGGAYSLAMGFFLSGTPAVVGSRWRVDDRATALLMSDFYRHLFATGDIAEALRSAKLEAMRRNGNGTVSWDWAAFELIGA